MRQVMDILEAPATGAKYSCSSLEQMRLERAAFNAACQWYCSDAELPCLPCPWVNVCPLPYLPPLELTSQLAQAVHSRRSRSDIRSLFPCCPCCPCPCACLCPPAFSCCLVDFQSRIAIALLLLLEIPWARGSAICS